MGRVTSSTTKNSSNKPRLLLIDGHSMAFRAFYALPAENFATSGGQHTNAVYGFLSMLANIIAEEKPEYVGVAFDVGRKTFRTEMFPEYKAQREAAPEEFRGQVDLIREVLGTLGITTLSRENFEADDIVATLATQATDFETLIVTGDRDYLQLVNEDTTVLYPMRGVSTLHRFTPDAVVEKYGLTPRQYPDFAALRGDPSDNLPSVPKVGEKTATKWILEYGSLEGLIEHAEDIKGVAGQNFRDRIEQVRMNRKLTQMITDMDLEVAPADLQFKGAAVSEVAERFDALEFGGGLRERVLDAIPNDGGEAPAQTEVPTQETEIVDAPLKQWLKGKKDVAVFVRVTGVRAAGTRAQLRLSTPISTACSSSSANSAPKTMQHSPSGLIRMRPSISTRPKQRSICLLAVASSCAALRTTLQLLRTCCALGSAPMSCQMFINDTLRRRSVKPAISCHC